MFLAGNHPCEEHPILPADRHSILSPPLYLRITHLAIFCLAGMLLFTGCIFSPHKGGGVIIVPPVYVKPLTPELVLDNLREAYTHKDSTAYQAVFDSLHFTGSYKDQNDPSPTTIAYTVAVEYEHIRYLVKSTANVTLTLVPSIIAYHDGGDPEGWLTVQSPFERLEIADSEGNTRYVQRSEDTMEIKFVPVPPNDASPDTTYKIIKIVEIRVSLTGT